MARWIYRYIRADLEEIDMGLYETEEEARKHSDKHAEFGAITSGPIAVGEDYKMYKGEG